MSFTLLRDAERSATEGRAIVSPTKRQFSVVAQIALVWAAGELLLLTLRSGYPFPALQLIDTWIYASFQWDLPGRMAEFGHTYYASRIPLFLPGAFLHALLPPVAANIAYKLLFSGLTTLALGFIALRFGGLRSSIVAAALATLTPWLVLIHHNDYMDIGVVLYASATLACMVGARDSVRPASWLFGAGFCFGAMTVTNLSSAIVPGTGLVAYYVAFAWGGLRRNWRVIGAGAAGGIAALAFFGAVSRLMGGSFWVMGSQIAALFQIGTMEQNPWAATGWRWLLSATWLLPPLAALFAGWHALAVRHADRALRALVIGHTVSLAAALAVEIHGTGVLFHWWYAVFQYPFSILILALCAGETRRTPLRATLLPLAALALIVVLANWPAWTSALHTALWLPFTNNTLALVAALATMLALTLRRSDRLFAGARIWAMVFVVLCSTPAGFHSPEVIDRLRERYLVVHAACAIIRAEFAPGSFRFWLGEDESTVRAVAAAHLFDYRLLTRTPFPGGDPDRVRLTEHTLIIPTTIGRGAERLALARSLLADFEMSDARIIPVPGGKGVGLDLVTFSLRERWTEPTTPPLLDLQHASGYLEQLEKMIYAPRLDDVPATESRGELPLFRRTTARDHLATRFLALPTATAEGRTVQVIIEGNAGGRGSCVVQSSDFRDLVTIPLGTAGTAYRRVPISGDTRAVRLYFISASDEPLSLPRRVRIFAGADE